MQPGETVLVIVSKAGYVVVNDIQMEQRLPTDPNSRSFVILICQPSRREEMARRFYHLVSWEAIDANYQKRLKELQAATAEQIALLQNERDQARSSADKMAEQLALAKPGQMSQLYNQALRLLVDGRTEEALKSSGRGGAAAKSGCSKEEERERREGHRTGSPVLGSEGKALYSAIQVCGRRQSVPGGNAGCTQKL